VIVIPCGFDPGTLLLLAPTEKQRCHLADPGGFVQSFVISPALTGTCVLNNDLTEMNVGPDAVPHPLKGLICMHKSLNDDVLSLNSPAFQYTNRQSFNQSSRV
jgi:hypothetical protein